MHSLIVGEASICPDLNTWEARREQFRRFESRGFGDKPVFHHPQIEPLIHELEHTYCAGAWIASLVIAHTMVEVFLHSKGVGKKNWKEVLAPHHLHDGVKWLCDRRNELLHMQNPEIPSVELDELLFNRDSLYHDAKKATSLAFLVVFLETRTVSTRTA